MLFGVGASQVCPACCEIWYLENTKITPQGTIAVMLQKLRKHEVAAMGKPTEGGS